MRPFVGALVLALVAATGGAEPLPSWVDGPSREAILGFVARVTQDNGPDYVPPPQRIVVFDNDGTLWSEQPIYVQFRFAMDRLKAMAPRHPEWKQQPPYAAAISDDLQGVAAGGMKGLMELLMASHSGMTTEAFASLVADWIETARHPRFQRAYTELVYQPMLELLAYLRERDFQIWIVSGGGVEFMRVFAEEVYGIPPERVIGSSILTEYRLSGDRPELLRKPELHFFDDKGGKPVAIHQLIGRRPIAAFGNSDGDLQMLQWTTLAPGVRLGVLIRHTDAEREWAYDRNSHIGRLDEALDEAETRGWTVVDMKRDWKRVYPFQATRAH